MRQSIRPILLGFFITLLWLMVDPASTYADEHAQISRFEPTDCPFNIPPGETINCGYLTVPENRVQPNGRTIRIFAAIVKSHSPTPP